MKRVNAKATIRSFEDCQAFLGRKRSREIANNTEVQYDNNYSPQGVAEVKLHGNTIIRYWNDGRIEVTTAGWNTQTTRQRLQQFGGVSVYTAKGQLYLNDEMWNGRWKEVTR